LVWSKPGNIGLFRSTGLFRDKSLTPQPIRTSQDLYYKRPSIVHLIFRMPNASEGNWSQYVIVRIQSQSEVAAI
jgi:hypothetical protein